MNKKIIMTIIVLFGIIASSCGMIYFENRNSNTNNKQKKELKSPNTFAIYLSNGSGGYTETDSIPSSGYALNFNRSVCLDINGNELENVLIGTDSDIVVVSSNKTLNCYLYYDQGSYSILYYSRMLSMANEGLAYVKYSSVNIMNDNDIPVYLKYFYSSGVIDHIEACGVFNNTEICLKSNDWSNASTYKNLFESAGATCNSTYASDNYLECSISGQFVFPYYNSLKCIIGSNGKSACGLFRDWNSSCVYVEPNGNAFDDVACPSFS